MSVYRTAREYAAESPVEIGWLGPISALLGTVEVGAVVHGCILSWREDPYPDPCCSSEGHQQVAEVLWRHGSVTVFWPASILRKEDR